MLTVVLVLATIALATATFRHIAHELHHTERI